MKCSASTALGSIVNNGEPRDRPRFASVRTRRAPDRRSNLLLLHVSLHWITIVPNRSGQAQAPKSHSQRIVFWSPEMRYQIACMIAALLGLPCAADVAWYEFVSLQGPPTPSGFGDAVAVF